MNRHAIASLLVGEVTTLDGITVARVGLIYYSVNGGPAVPLDAAVIAVDALASAAHVEPSTSPLDAAKVALSQYRIALPSDLPGLVTLAARLRKYHDADADRAADTVDAVVATMAIEGEQVAA